MHTHSSASPRGATCGQVPGRRRTGAASVAAVLALGLVPALPGMSPAQAAVTIGSNISVFPDRDMVVAVGYRLGERLRVEVLRNDVVIGTTEGPAARTPEGIGLEVNHGPVGTAQPGDCWEAYTPDIIGGDVIRVTALDRPGMPVDTSTVRGITFTDEPRLDPNGNVFVTGTVTAGTTFAVEFRRDKPDPRFRRGPFAPEIDAATGTWRATFQPTADSDEGLTEAQQRSIALNEASWLAVADTISETTLAELGEAAGPAAGCPGSADANSLVGGLDPINIASGDVTFSGTTRPGVTAVSVTVGALGDREATVTAGGDATAAGTWTLTVSKTDLATLPDGTVTVTPRFGTTAGAPRSVLKDTVAPAAPTATPTPGTYAGTQHVTLNKPAGETTSKTYWTIGSATTVTEPDATSTLYTSQIAVSATQTIQARLIDAAGNPGAVGTFDYRIGTPPAAPTGVTATEARGGAQVSWSPVSGATGYNVYRSGATTPLHPTPLTTTSFADSGLANGTYTYVVRAVESNGIESVASTPVSATLAPPAVPRGLSATPGNGQVTLTWTRNTETDLASYELVREGRAPVPVGETQSSHTDTGLTNGTLHTYALIAVDDVGNRSDATGAVQATPAPPADTTPPPAPSVTPITGTYSSAQSVTMTNTETDAVIRYTVGTGTTAPADPTASSTQYTGPISVDSTQVIKVAAFDAAGNRSPITERSYTITPPPPADTTPPPAPSASLASGTYSSAQSVTMTNTETDAVIRYTVGTGTTAPADPTASSTQYTGPISVDSTQVIKVAAFDAAGNRSPITERSYTITPPPPADTTPPPAPSASLASGTYSSAQSVTMTNTETDAVIRYTVGTGTTAPADPTASSTQYTGPISVTSSQVIKVAAFDAAGNRSPITERSYTISTATPPPPSGTTRTVVVDATADTMVRQNAATTTFGTATTLAADAQTGTNTSSRETTYLRFTVPALAAGETITGASLSLNSVNGTVNGPSIYRTSTTWTEGTMTWNSGQPTRSSSTTVGNFGNVGTGRVSTPITGITTAGAVSFQLYADNTDGFDFNSRETPNRPQLTLTIASSGTTAPPPADTTPPPADTTPPPAPSASLASGTYSSAQSVTMTNTETDAVIRYTVGTGTTAPADPTASSTQYTGPISVTSSQVIKVAAFDAAGNRSPITERSYTISTATPPPPSGTTRTVVVDATADTMVRQNAATTTFGTATTLAADAQTGTNTSSRETTYLRFTVPALAAGETITGASLSLNSVNGTVNGPSIYRTSTTWTEGTMTWNSGQPTRSSSTTVGNFGNVGTGRVSTPITGITTAGAVSFQLYADNTDGFDFNSRETPNRPQLTLTISSP